MLKPLVFIFIMFTPYISYSQTVSIEQCFDSFLDKSIEGRFDRLTECVKLYRSKQPLAVPETKYNYSENHTLNEFIMALEYISHEKPAGTNIDSLKDVRTKAKSVFDSSHCKDDYPLGRIWCNKMQRLSQLQIEATSSDDYLTSIKPEDKNNYLLCVRTNSSDPNYEKIKDKRTTACEETCKEGHMYRFTCELLKNDFSVSMVIKRQQGKCYGGDNRECRLLCEENGELSACSPEQSASDYERYVQLVLAEGWEGQAVGGSSQNEFPEDPCVGQPNEANCYKEILEAYNEDGSSIESGTVQRASIPENAVTPSNETLTIQRPVTRESNGEEVIVGWEKVNVSTSEYNRKYRGYPILGSSISGTQNIESKMNIPSIDVKSSSQNIGFSNSSNGSYKARPLGINPTVSPLSVTALSPQQVGGSPGGTPKASGEQADKGRSIPDLGSSSVGSAGFNSDNNSSNVPKNNPKDYSSGLPYKDIRNNLGGHTYFGTEGSYKPQASSEPPKAQKRVINKVYNKYAGSTYLPTPEEIENLKRSYKNGLSGSGEYLMPQESIFEKQSDIYTDHRQRYNFIERD